MSIIIIIIINITCIVYIYVCTSMFVTGVMGIVSEGQSLTKKSRDKIY